MRSKLLCFNSGEASVIRECLHKEFNKMQARCHRFFVVFFFAQDTIYIYIYIYIYTIFRLSVSGLFVFFLYY